MKNRKKLFLLLVKGDPYLLSNDEIKVNDQVIDTEALRNGYSDVVRVCEDEKDAEHLNSTNGAYQKVFCGPGRMAWLHNDGPPHDHNWNYGKDGKYVEPATIEVYQRILETGGICYAEMEFDEFGYQWDGPALFMDKVIIHVDLDSENK
jgi:hypothetical protein